MKSKTCGKACRHFGASTLKNVKDGSVLGHAYNPLVCEYVHHYIHTCLFSHKRTHTYTNVSTYYSMCMCVCIHTHTHIDTHKCTRPCRSTSPYVSIFIRVCIPFENAQKALRQRQFVRPCAKDQDVCTSLFDGRPIRNWLIYQSIDYWNGQIALNPFRNLHWITSSQTCQQRQEKDI